LGRSIQLRLAAAILLTLAPPAILLGWLPREGRLGWPWAVGALVAGLVLGILATSAIAAAWTRSTERVGEAAAALEERRPPAHLHHEGADAMGLAEHRLLVVADAVAHELEVLAEQRDEFEAILRSMTEAVVVTGRRGDVVLVNGAARGMFALDADTDYRGRAFVELCRDARLQEFVAHSMSAAADDGMVSAQFQIQNPAPHFLAANAAPVRTNAGAAAFWVLVFHDITQLKSYETVRADFIANLTHEIRTPLSALCGYAETLVAGVEDPGTQRRFLGIIERQARRLARLIDDLITLSDLERGLSPLRLESLEIRRVADEAVELMRERAARQGVTLETRYPEEIVKVGGDRDRLNQVLINLIDNAIKYTPRGGRVTVEVRAARNAEPPVKEPRDGAEVAVADSGEGIPAADIPRLTERFYRVDRARSRELGGTGLGLAIVKHIVQLHRGQLRIESRLREGTTVTVWLPAAPAPASQPTPASQPALTS
jgi:two-component system, OmpR family, phosphate regulon sensor histidine kinase PhoR